MSAAWNRREILTQVGVLALAGGWPELVLGRERLPCRAIPCSGEKLPVIGLGSTKPVREIATKGTGPLAEVIRVLRSFGGCVVDTAPRPAEIDTAFGQLLDSAEFRDALFIATKINARGGDAGVAQFRQTQRLFRRPTLDLVQVESMVDLDAHWPSLTSFKQAGEARYIGVTVAHEDHYPALESFMRSESPDFIQLNYSVVETLAEATLLPLASELGVAVLVNGPFMNGEYFKLTRGRELPSWSSDFDCSSWAQFSLKYILGHPAVTCVLTETTSSLHMRENVGAAFGSLPDEETRKLMRQTAKALI